MIKGFKIFFFIGSVCFLSNAFSQNYFRAGDIVAYTDIPDVIVSYDLSFEGSESFFIDFNGDTQNDIEINATGFQAAGAGETSINVRALNPDFTLRLGRIDSTFNTFSLSWMFLSIALPMNLFDTINSSDANWSAGLYLRGRLTQPGGAHIFEDWGDSTDHYLGIRFQNSTDTIFGWLRMICTSTLHTGQCIVKDYSFSSESIGVSEEEKTILSLYPNPTSGKFYVTSTNYSDFEISLLDLTGRRLSCTQHLERNILELDPGPLNDGVYLVSLKSALGVVMKKIMVAQ